VDAKRNPGAAEFAVDRGASDEQLLSHAASGCQISFAELYDRHATMAHSLALRMVRDAQVAQDVTQMAFIDAWRHAASFDASRGSVRPWLLSILRNRAIDSMRRRNVQYNRQAAAERAEAVSEASPVPDDLLIKSERARVVRRAVASLPPPQREVVELAYFRGLSHREISERLTLPLGTVKGRMRLGLERLRVAVGTDGLGEAPDRSGPVASPPPVCLAVVQPAA